MVFATLFTLKRHFGQDLQATEALKSSTLQATHHKFEAMDLILKLFKLLFVFKGMCLSHFC